MGNIVETRPFVPWEQMNNFMVDAFKGYGVPEEDAKICADVLLESDRRGIESHGCNRFKPIYIDRIVKGTLLPVTEIEILKETPTTIVMDAHDGMGMVASYRMMEKLIEKAKTYGMAGGAIRNSTHYGIAGYWTSMASKEGMVGITGTNARPSIAPTFGVENMLGTNPLTFSIPTDEEFPFCLDCATSIVQRGRIEYYAREGKPTPAGTVISENGEALTDSQQILKDLVSGTAALAPLGGIGEELAGYKGYGYAAVVEILSAELIGIIPEDTGIITSTNKGEPIVNDENSLAGRAYRNVAERIMGNDVPIIDFEEEAKFSNKVKKFFSKILKKGKEN